MNASEDHLPFNSSENESDQCVYMQKNKMKNIH